MAPKASALLLGAAALLGGCAIIPRPEGAVRDRPPALKSISYESGACSTLCPVYRVTVTADGKGLFEGLRYTAALGRHRFAVSPGVFAAFAAQLEPVRPTEALSPYDSRRGCETRTEGLPAVEIGWRGTRGLRQTLLYDFGCNPERNRSLSDQIGQAPSLLPIAALIGPLP
ncbi:MAG: hypothetical protein JWN69_2056 [Alphaproteobacteria bacterium]|nr:hypothetical protein [Alphaproteobacteria bacterium]